MSNDQDLLKFAAFKSQVDPSFWQRLTELKLDKDKLNENIHQIWGYYSNKKPEGQNQLFSVDASSFNKIPDENRIFGVGSVINKNTIEGFKDENIGDLINNAGSVILKLLENEALEKPCLLAKFLIISFANLKNYTYHYWFAFPAPKFFFCKNLESPKNVTEVFDKKQLDDLYDCYKTKFDNNNRGFFFVRLKNNGVELFSVKEGVNKVNSEENWFLGFADTSNSVFPSWPLRNFLALVIYHCKEFIKKPLKIICLRLDFLETKWTIMNSIILNVKVILKEETFEKSLKEASWVGWEKNEKGKLVPQLANLKQYMDPISLAESSVDLNLKLMKWQILPNLDLDLVKKSKCLLIGAGTLGCVVARNLMSWGVRHITFVDYGKVSYSNPVRQFLYNFNDVGKPKAEAAAAALKEIFPGMVSSGFSFTVPMPGHPVGESLIEETRNNIEKLQNLIEEHDVTFLLMDSRESRWLPTLIASAKGKLVINAALGFDSYLVMRHRVKNTSITNELEVQSGKVLSGDKLGCYFCNDITAPGNSSRGRTLDQQCTVTRPGVSNIAGAVAVELFVSILQHPLKGLAPAETDSEVTETESVLGMVPHSIRGFISHYQTVLPAVEAFSSCVACSCKVINKYYEDNFDFIFKSLESKEYLEELCGLTELFKEPIMEKVLDYSDSECDE